MTQRLDWDITSRIHTPEELIKRGKDDLTSAVFGSRDPLMVEVPAGDKEDPIIKKLQSILPETVELEFIEYPEAKQPLDIGILIPKPELL